MKPRACLIMDDPSDHSLVEAVISLSRKLGHVTVAEGVETDMQRQELQRLGCNLGQGHLVGKPIAVEAFEAFEAFQAMYLGRGPSGVPSTGIPSTP